MSVGKLNVNLLDLSRAADDYAELQTAAAAISPQAVDEVQRIIATHGPMGYPVAVGVVARLARRQGPLEAKAAQFGRYSQRFHEHAATYRSADQEAAQRFEALDFSEGVIEPKPNNDEPAPPFSKPKLTCWIGTADGDTSVCSEDATEYMYVEDGTWKIRQVDNGWCQNCRHAMASSRPCCPRRRRRGRIRSPEFPRATTRWCGRTPMARSAAPTASLRAR